MFVIGDISNNFATAAATAISTVTIAAVMYDCQLKAKTPTDYHTLDNGSSDDDSDYTAANTFQNYCCLLFADF